MEETVRRTAVNYTTFLPNDPVREWKAWTQDIENMFGSAIYLFAESQTMYERWQHDLLDSQRSDGNVANVAPGPVFDDYNSPWWGGCVVWLPWEWRLAYGDDSLLRESYPGMKRYLRFLDNEARKAEGMQTWGLGDWLPVEETPVVSINTPAHFHCAWIVCQAAGCTMLGDEMVAYARQADEIRHKYDEVFLDPKTGIYGQRRWKVSKGNWEVPGGLEALHEIWWQGDRPCTQAGQVLPLALGMVPDAHRAAVVDALLREVVAHKGRVSTGFVSTPYLLDVLSDVEPEACWRMCTAREFPSWHAMTAGSGNDLQKETWAGGQALMPSLGGSFARWCYRGLGGIRTTEDGPGFKHVVIRPGVVKDLQWVECFHDGPYGRIVSNWRKHDGKLIMEIVVPPGCRGTIVVPATRAAAIAESGRPLGQSTGVRVLAEGGQGIELEVQAGRYVFEAGR
jgi:alpha-L-rhamnosidase